MGRWWLLLLAVLLLVCRPAGLEKSRGRKEDVAVLVETGACTLMRWWIWTTDNSSRDHQCQPAVLVVHWLPSSHSHLKCTCRHYIVQLQAKRRLHSSTPSNCAQP